MTETGYATDLTDEQWALVEPFVRAAYSGLGPYHKISRRAIVDAILYQNRTGCQWRLIPRDFPNWHTVRHYYDRWRLDGTWERLNEALNVQVRERAGKEPTPSVLIVDSQSARSTEMGGEVGVDGGKKGQGPQAAAGGGHAGAALAGGGARGEHRRLRWGLAAAGGLRGAVRAPGQGAGGQRLRARGPLGAGARRPGLRPGGGRAASGATGFAVQHLRWIVEQSIACLGRDRRLAKDYEYVTSSSEARVLIAAIGRSLRRLARGPAQRIGYQRSTPPTSAAALGASSP